MTPVQGFIISEAGLRNIQNEGFLTLNPESANQSRYDLLNKNIRAKISV